MNIIRKAALMLAKSHGDYDYICGGVLIDDETVVTVSYENFRYFRINYISEISAAHCVRPLNYNQFLARDLAVAFGSYDTSKKSKLVESSPVSD